MSDKSIPSRSKEECACGVFFTCWSGLSSTVSFPLDEGVAVDFSVVCSGAKPACMGEASGATVDEVAAAPLAEDGLVFGTGGALLLLKMRRAKSKVEKAAVFIQQVNNSSRCTWC